MTTSIIVYRNPAEQAFWEGVTGSELTFPIFVAALVFFAAAAITARLLDSRSLRKFLPCSRDTINVYLPLAAGAGASALTLWVML